MFDWFLYIYFVSWECVVFFFFSSRRRHTRYWRDWSSDVCSSDLADFAARVRARGLTPGVMIEVPSAALMAERLLQHVDFLSIGTNDLSQYTLAADRLSADLADLTDPWQPALLALVQLTAEAGRRTGQPVGVCGEAAADPLLACVLIGLGITSLSCAASSIAGVGARLAVVDTDACQRAADAALLTDDPHAARAAARRELGVA